MNLSPSLKVSAEDKTVKFVGFNLEGKPTPYTLRIKSEEMARELVSNIDREIEAMEEA